MEMTADVWMAGTKTSGTTTYHAVRVCVSRYTGTEAAVAQAKLLGNVLPQYSHDGIALRLASMSNGPSLNPTQALAAVATAQRKRQEGGKGMLPMNTS